MTTVEYIREVANEYWKNKAKEEALNPDNILMKEIHAWALNLAKEGKYSGMFNLSAFQEKHPEYRLDMNVDRHLITNCGYRVRGKVQKECRFHSRQICICWGEEEYWDPRGG